MWGRNGVVATADQLASLAGVRMLMKGGNAIDAIVAASAALNVVEPYMSGMGGFGGYMIIYLAAERKVVALDMMGVTSTAATPDKFTEQDFDEGYKAPVVPGNIGGWAEALSRYGTMSLGDVFEPAIELAERGFVADQVRRQFVCRGSEQAEEVPDDRSRRSCPTATSRAKGRCSSSRISPVASAALLSKASTRSTRARLADEIVTFLQQNGGLLTKQDFAAFKPRWREPIQTTFNGHTLSAWAPARAR